jgi:hypothetical protein
MRGRVTRLTGAALQAKVTAEARRMLAEAYGLPMDEYTSEAGQYPGYGYDGEIPTLWVAFKRRSNGREVRIDDIYPTDNGEIDQYSGPELR